MYASSTIPDMKFFKKNRKRRFLGLIIIVAALITGFRHCSDNYEGHTKIAFNLESYNKVWDLPFPSDLGIDPDGKINMNGFPDTLLLRKMSKNVKSAVQNGYGISTNPTIYFSFNNAIHPRRIPETLTTIQPGSPVFLIDIDPDSPEQGKRFPLRIKFSKKKPRLGYGPSNLLSILPVPGFTLRKNTTYAAVIMDTLRDENHKLLESPPEFELLKQGKIPAGSLGKKATEIYKPMFDYLKTQGVNTKRIAGATVFTTGDPTQRLQILFDSIKDAPAAKVVTPFKVTSEFDTFYVLEGKINMPLWQPGTFPYKDGGGIIQFDKNGIPIVQKHEAVPVCLSVPKGKMPPNGWPLMIYIHGSDGLSTQHVDRGVKLNSKDEKTQPGTGPSMILAHRGIATVGAALPGWRERNNNKSAPAYYNFFNVEALRDNFVQSAAEQSVLLRVMKELKLDPKLCPKSDASLGVSGHIFFDANLLFTMGQSLGSQVVMAFGAVETDVKVVIPSGAGAHFSVYMSRQNVFDWEFLRKSGEGFGEMLGFDMFHPLISLSQNALAATDQVTYARHLVRDPLPGRNSKHVWLSLGQFDHYSPSASQNAIFMGSGLDFVGEINDGSITEILALAGKKPLDYPVSGNITGKDGNKYTGVSLHYEQYGALDGHHINFQRNETKYQYGCFLRSFLDEGVPTLFAPRLEWDAPCGPR